MARLKNEMQLTTKLPVQFYLSNYTMEKGFVLILSTQKKLEAYQLFIGTIFWMEKKLPVEQPQYIVLRGKRKVYRLQKTIKGVNRSPYV